MFSSSALKSRALELGFNLVGITPAAPSPQLAAYERWVQAGMHGSMNYMARPDRITRRRDLNAILPGVRSLVVVGLDYSTTLLVNSKSSPPGPLSASQRGGEKTGKTVLINDLLTDPSRGRIAAYAWGLDYHDILKPKLERLAEWLREASGQSISHRVYVDTGAVLERSHAQQAGLGFTGKNTMLIHPRRGSNFFLGEILTDLDFDDYDKPVRETMCGSCTRCLTACPTNAFPQPHVLDARRCISYLTIEHKGNIDPALRPLMGNWVFGCDICQEVCPFQRFAAPTHEPAFYPADTDRAAPPLLDLLALDEAAFHQRYYGSPIYRIKRERLMRNACIAAGNWGHADALLPLEHLLRDPSPLIRAHAAWALWQIAGEEARGVLQALLIYEADKLVRGELINLLK